MTKYQITDKKTGVIVNEIDNAVLLRMIVGTLVNPENYSVHCVETGIDLDVKAKSRFVENACSSHFK